MEHDRQDDATSDGGIEGIGDEIRQLIAAARERAETEIAYQKARAGLVGRWAGMVAALGCAGVAALLLAGMAAVFGLVLALAVRLGPWAATGIVVGLFLVLSAVALLAAWSRVRRILAFIREIRP